MMQSVDPDKLRVDYARWMVWLFALTAPAAAVLLVAGTWSIAAEAHGPIWTILLTLAPLWAVFLSLLIVPESWYLVRIWRGVPALQIDSRGLLWGNDWDHDVGIEWHEIARIRGRPLRSRYYSDRLLLVEPRDPTILGRFSRLQRALAWLGGAMYGSPFVIGLGTMRIQSDDLVAAIRRRYSGPIDLSEIR